VSQVFRYFSVYKQLIVGKTFICMQPCLWLAVTYIQNIAYIEKVRSLVSQYGGDLVIVWYGSFSSVCGYLLSCRYLQPSGCTKLYWQMAEAHACKHEIATIQRNNLLGMQTEARNFHYCLLSVDWSHILSLCQHCLVGIHSDVDMFSAFSLYSLEAASNRLLNAAVFVG